MVERLDSNAATDNGFLPAAPRSLEETGLNLGLVADLALKMLYFEGYMQASKLADSLCLPFSGVIDSVLEFIKRERLVEIKGSGSGALREAGYQYAITDRGAQRARDLLERSQYVGPAPVTLDDYRKSVRAQSVKDVFVTPTVVRRLALAPGVGR